jgi:hypothetical protein
MKHTPGPWKWEGEDYRGNWGWQILVGANGEGIIIGQDNDGRPSKHIKIGLPIEPELCITGLSAEGKEHVNAVHVFSQANARLISKAPDMLELLKGITVKLTYPVDWSASEQFDAAMKHLDMITDKAQKLISKIEEDKDETKKGC